MTIKKYDFIVEKTSDGYAAYCEPLDGGIIATTGETIAEVKINALEALNLTLDDQNKKQVTEDSINLVYDLPQFFDYYKVINTTQLASRLKINRSLLSQYITGQKKPSPSQTLRILNGVKNLGKELSVIDFI